MSTPDAAAPVLVPAPGPAEGSVLSDGHAQLAAAVGAGIGMASAPAVGTQPVRGPTLPPRGAWSSTFRSSTSRSQATTQRRPLSERAERPCLMPQNSHLAQDPSGATNEAASWSSALPLDVPRSAGLPPLGSPAFHPATPAMMGCSAPLPVPQPCSLSGSMNGTPPFSSSPRLTGSLRTSGVGVSKKPSRAGNAVRGRAAALTLHVFLFLSCCGRPGGRAGSETGP